MDSTKRLQSAADDLERVARALLGIEHADRPTDRPSQQLGRAVARWMIATRRLATSGIAMWASGSPNAEPPADLPGPAQMVAEVDATNALVAGDLAVDAFAYAELVRRKAAPTWKPGQRIPGMWEPLVRLVEAESSDAILRPVRYLDVTLAPARDLLVAHPDPTTYDMPSFMSMGHVQLARPSVDPEREAAALDALRLAAKDQRVSYGLDADYHRLLDYLQAIAGLLDRPAREAMKRAYRLAGYDAPPMTTIIPKAVGLFDRFLSLIDA